jgi:hypothetical protein
MIFKDVIEIRDCPIDRAVQVTVIYPDDMNVTNVQELAERAWRAVGKTLTARHRDSEGRGLRRQSQAPFVGRHMFSPTTHQSAKNLTWRGKGACPAKMQYMT